VKKVVAFTVYETVKKVVAGNTTLHKMNFIPYKLGPVAFIATGFT